MYNRNAKVQKNNIYTFLKIGTWKMEYRENTAAFEKSKTDGHYS